MKFWNILLFLLLAAGNTAYGKVTQQDLEDIFTQGIDIDLVDPEYCDGVLSTMDGGVVTACNLRIQARRITYTKKEDLEIIDAEGDLMVEFGRYVFVGQRIEYDFKNNSGIIFCGRASVEPWFFGGEYILLMPDGTIEMHHGFLTTSQNIQKDWEITSPDSSLQCNRYLLAHNVKFNFFNVPLFWLPKFNIDLKTILNSPIRYSIRWGGQQGPRARMIYEIFSWDLFRAYARLEYRLRRGFGGGIVTDYAKPNSCEYMHTLSYVANDNSVCDPNLSTRYRFHGIYHNLLQNGKTRVEGRYDKLSDRDMATDYCDESLAIEAAGRTEFYLRHREPEWTLNFYTHVRFNTFETINQELPTLQGSVRPYILGPTGIIGETLLKASYLDFEYANNISNVTDYHSPRYEARQQFYRPFTFCDFTFTPEAELVAINYGNSPNSDSQTLVSGVFTFTGLTKMHRFYGPVKHVIKPYGVYQYVSFPTSEPSQHYIFDIDDGWYRLDTLRFGMEHSFYCRNSCNNTIRRCLDVDLYSIAFFDTPTVVVPIPKVYSNITYYATRTWKNCIDTAWDCLHNELDHFNILSEWTLSANFAISAEYRHRDVWDWRKADHSNFIIDSYRPIDQLLFSQMSDRRDTFLVHTFFRFHPYWAFEFQLRSGWDRVVEPAYTEYQADLHVNLQSSWRVKFSYQKKMDDHRVAFYFSMGAKCPNQCDDCCTPWPEF